MQLAYGRLLRRNRTGAESRPYLAAALEAFERLGARPWARRAADELRATGRARSRTEDLTANTLPAHERRIVELAADGLTNKEIGARLFLSHRTVAAHLYRVFSKLGITSCAALGHALAALPAEDPAERPDGSAP